MRDHPVYPMARQAFNSVRHGEIECEGKAILLREAILALTQAAYAARESESPLPPDAAEAIDTIEQWPPSLNAYYIAAPVTSVHSRTAYSGKGPKPASSHMVSSLVLISGDASL